jgi:hypothetical protein
MCPVFEPGAYLYIPVCADAVKRGDARDHTHACTIHAAAGSVIPFGPSCC